MEYKKPLRLNHECISCLVNKQLRRYPEDAAAEQKTEYMQSVLRAVADAPGTMSAPEIMESIYAIQKRMFGMEKDYSEIKRHFNGLMLELEDGLKKEIYASRDPLKLAVRYAMTGNYIDFAAMDSIDEEKLGEFIAGAKDNPVDGEALAGLKSDLERASRLVYLTDNCGEIVFDKLLIGAAKQLYPQLDVTVIVRGYPVVNDATAEDAEQVGLTGIAEVIGNGMSVAGTCLDRISEEARRKIGLADVIIAKGQGNFETLRMCGLNIYYIFMCKCAMFADRFNVPMYHGILVNDRSLKG